MNSLGNTDFSFASTATTAAAAGGQPASPTAAATTTRTEDLSTARPLPKTYAYIFPFTSESTKSDRIVFRVQMLTEETMQQESLNNLRSMAFRVGCFIKGGDILNGSPHRLNNTLYVPPTVYSEIPSKYMEDGAQSPANEVSVNGAYLVNAPDTQPEGDIRAGRAEVRYIYIDPHNQSSINYMCDTSCKVEQTYDDDEAGANQYLRKFIAEKELVQAQAAAMRKAQEEAAAKAPEEANKKAQEEAQKGAYTPPQNQSPHQSPPPDSCCTIL